MSKTAEGRELNRPSPSLIRPVMLPRGGASSIWLYGPLLVGVDPVGVVDIRIELIDRRKNVYWGTHVTVLYVAQKDLLEQDFSVSSFQDTV